MAENDGEKPGKGISLQRILIILLVVVALPLPIIFYEVISDFIGGSTEAEHLLDMSPEQRQALQADNLERWQESRDYLRKVAAGTAENPEPDRVAYYMVQEFIRLNLGPSKVLRFPTLESAKVIPGTDGAFAIRSAVLWWGGKDYVPAPFEAVIMPQADGSWKLDWLNIQRRKGKVRAGQVMTMPTEEAPAMPPLPEGMVGG